MASLALIFTLVILAASCGDGKVARLQRDSCNKQRKVLTGSYGTFSDGPKEYPEDSYCEWLILAPSPSQYITLEFDEMDTECSYDHLYVYDGSSYNSTLLGSLSGSTLPSPLTARSGSMLVMLYSDTNYVRQGFKARWSATDCPLNCSNHGTCDSHFCVCEPLWRGEACDRHLCPDQCIAKGLCELIPEPPHCACTNGSAGDSCSLPSPNSSLLLPAWHLLSREGAGLSPRAGHASAYLSHTDQLYIFGGFSFEMIFGDLLLYDFTQSQWFNLTESSPTKPSPRWGHAMTPFNKHFVLFGGELSNGSFSNELWLFNITKRHWDLLEINNSYEAPRLAKHTLTLVEEKWLYVFGGIYSNGRFSSDIYSINLLEDPPHWVKISPLGGKALDRRLVGHSTVYHSASKSLLVYGGITVDYARFSKLSDSIHAFNIEKMMWSKIVYPKLDSTYVPLERAFHAMVLVNDYLVVLGGYIHRHSHEEICYDREIYIFDLLCGRWINYEKLTDNLSNPLKQGLFSHTMDLRQGGNTLLISGGYSGIMKGALWAHVLPPAITDSIGMACSRHKNKDECRSNLRCGWCLRPGGQGHCLERKSMKECNFGLLSIETCPGLCPTFKECSSCLLRGDSCQWYPASRLCLPISSDDSVFIHVMAGSLGNKNGLKANGDALHNIEDCPSKDRPPGLTAIHYRHPINWQHPDDVMYVNQSAQDVHFYLQTPREHNGDSLARLLGFIKPHGIPGAPNLQAIKLYMRTAGGSATLRLSNGSSPQYLEVVANHSSGSIMRTEAHRHVRGPVFLSSSTPRYLLDFQLSIPASFNASATMQLLWNAEAHRSMVITEEFLQPYEGTNVTECHSYSTCLACLVDSRCGWCDDKCMSRNEATNCPIMLVIEPLQCPRCSDYIYCQQCSQESSCEWLIEEAHCVRRGRFKDAIRMPHLCPKDCYLRENCSTCLGEPGRCAWCEETQQCFLFATYTTSFMFGRCREWVDEDRSIPKGVSGNQCRDCSRHLDCRSCLFQLSCGWCSANDNLSFGFCVDGDYSRPHAGPCESLMPSSFPSDMGNLSFSWYYTSCPDIDECKLGLHSCHKYATCTNTPESYLCTCNSGYKGEGISNCEKTCLEECVHGHCSEAPDYQCICDLGWTGADCSIDCGCHNHSFCPGGIGICDDCLDWTEGEFCHLCKSGSFGNATLPQGCQPCQCNGHADRTLGSCDKVTGECLCQDNTEGPNCQLCKPGFFGDPRNGGHCYEPCLPRAVISNVQLGRLGSHFGPDESSHCLWILTVHPSLELNETRRNIPALSTSSEATIQLIIEPGQLNIPCPYNHIYVYDGLPEFVLKDSPRILLGALCGTNLSSPISKQARSGYMSIFYHRGNPPYAHGFNATYQKLESACTLNCNLTNETCPLDSCQMEKTSFPTIPLCSNHSIGELDPNKNGAFNSCHPHHPLIWWESVSSELPLELPSFGYSLHSTSAALWLFGGYSYVPSPGPSNAMWVFRKPHEQTSSLPKWKMVVPSSRSNGLPPRRHFHASALWDSSIYILGGLGEGGNVVWADFWRFDTPALAWTPLKAQEVPPLAGHTLTPVQSHNYLVLIGGYSPSYGFLEKVFAFNLVTLEWVRLNTTGALPIGLYGHSAVHHNETIYVWGGLVYDTLRPEISSDLYAFHVVSGQWSRLPVNRQVNPNAPPRPPSYLHSAISTPRYMLLLGGSSPAGDRTRLTAYIYSCNFWLDLEEEEGPDASNSFNIPWIEMDVSSKSVIEDQSSKSTTTLWMLSSQKGLFKLHLPADLCHLYTSSHFDCLKRTGCSFCTTYESGRNNSYCYAGDMPLSCSNPRGTSEVLPGTSCTSEWLSNRDCYQYTSCTDCVAFWPTHKTSKQVCQWCSNCQVGRCVSAGASCERENECSVPQRVVTQPSACPRHVCLATDCTKCTSLGGPAPCMWTRQVLRSSEWGHTLNIKPIFDWTCVRQMIQEASSFPIEAMPPLACPAPCHSYTNCNDCISSGGSDGGWNQCHWATALNQCVSPSFEPLVCVGGHCGSLVTKGNHSKCPLPCWEYTQAASCLLYPHCGWCSFPAILGEESGRGICLPGGLDGPAPGAACNDAGVYLPGVPLPDHVVNWLAASSGPPMWWYLQAPPENECLNGHHDCNPDNQECQDLPQGYKCHCKKGYTGEEGKDCQPVCTQGCKFGTCIQPDVCQCHFGYVGHNCSIQCECNKHSDCAGPDQLDTCLECHNNTQGDQCQHCKPFFVGNPVNGGRCIPCKVYCHGHSEVCLAPDLYNATLLASSPTLPHILEQMSGPLDDAICLDCRNFTEGNRCDQCMPGYFKAGENIKEGCRLCECHGHGDMCNPINGENCNCHNNTENDRQCSQKNSKNLATPCWLLQCSKCKEYFLGTPTHGHQCYRHMFLDKDYCFDPNTQEECNRKPNALPFGRTVFFVVHPRYMNVDIRIIVDVTEGGIDFFLSTKEDTFVVLANKSSGIHEVHLDRKYGPGWEEDLPDDGNVTILIPKVVKAAGLTTYITLKEDREFLLVRNLQNRLVITIPQEVHDLRNVKFFMVLHGATVRPTYGSLFFRQDQTRIDLFVFFSVFFSCFFLFLALCVTLWKIKQAFDLRRARQLHAAEMKHMANRPFARVMAIIEKDFDEFEYCYTPLHHAPTSTTSPSYGWKKSKHKAMRDSPKVSPVLIPTEKFCTVWPVAIEPVVDNFGGVASVLIQLPGGPSAPVKMCIGSSLVTLRSCHLVGSGFRAAMRRRTSHMGPL